jgi:hypothetical protein
MFPGLPFTHEIKRKEGWKTTTAIIGHPSGQDKQDGTMEGEGAIVEEATTIIPEDLEDKAQHHGQGLISSRSVDMTNQDTATMIHANELQLQ